MNFTKTTDHFVSSNKVDKIAYYVYTPPAKPKALIQIAHGACEYAERYEPFIDFLCGEGYAVIANDCLGHGNSVQSPDDLGYFAVHDGWICLIKDFRKTAVKGREMFPDIPYFIIGHSMGSLIERCYIAKYSDETDGAVMLGTVGRRIELPAAIALADSEIALHGVKSRSRRLKTLIFGDDEKRTSDSSVNGNWLTRDEKIAMDYINNPKCGFTFTSSAFRDMFILLQYCSSPSWYKKVRKDLPILLMSGSDDPMGGNGKGVLRIFTELVRFGFKDTEVKIEDGCRHELLNEINREEIYDEISHWLKIRVNRLTAGE